MVTKTEWLWGSGDLWPLEGFCVSNSSVHRDGSRCFRPTFTAKKCHLQIQIFFLNQSASQLVHLSIYASAKSIIREGNRNTEGRKEKEKERSLVKMLSLYLIDHLIIPMFRTGVDFPRLYVNINPQKHNRLNVDCSSVFEIQNTSLVMTLLLLKKQQLLTPTHRYEKVLSHLCFYCSSHPN